jgi:osmotically inducible protein OsmC
MKILYTAEATVEGGRSGRVRTDDGRLDVQLDVPAGLGGEGGQGTNPEQLFAAGYASCFHQALQSVAGERDVDISASRLTARVGLGPREGGQFALTVELDLDAPGVSAADAAALMHGAHGMCPYSHATRGNIDVALKANGEPVAAAG